MSEKSSVVPAKIKTEPDAGRDPVRIMMEIAENEKISHEDKTALILHAQSRFTNRRLMAYTALTALIISLALLFIAAFIDGLTTCPEGRACQGILESIENSQTLITWVEGFLTAIVAAYFGISAWRPAS